MSNEIKITLPNLEDLQREFNAALVKEIDARERGENTQELTIARKQAHAAFWDGQVEWNRNCTKV